MKITRIIFGIVLLCLPATVSAQTNSGEFSITGQSIDKEDGQLRIVLDIKASQLNLSNAVALD